MAPTEKEHTVASPKNTIQRRSFSLMKYNNIDQEIPKHKIKMASPVSADEFLSLGLVEYNFCPHYQNYRNVELHVQTFRRYFGATPKTCSQLWDAFIHLDLIGKKAKPIHLLLATRFLWKYDTELELKKDFKIKTDRTVNKWVKIYLRLLEKVLSLKVSIILWPVQILFQFSHCSVTYSIR